MVLADLLCLHRTEGTKTHVKGHIGQGDTLLFNLLQKLFGKMQACGGSRSGAGLPGIHRLVPLLVLELCLDVRRQGHFPQVLQNLQKDSLIMEPDNPVAVLLDFLHRSGQLAVSEDDLLAGAELLSGLCQTFPLLIPQIPQQKQLYSASCGAVAQKPGRQHPGIVHHQAVPGVQVFHNIVKVPVRELPGFLIHDQKPGTVPLLQWSLGNQLLGKIIPKIFRLEITGGCLGCMQCI